MIPLQLCEANASKRQIRARFIMASRGFPARFLSGRITAMTMPGSRSPMLASFSRIARPAPGCRLSVGCIRERFENALRVDESLSPFLAIVRALSLFWRDLARLRLPPALARWRPTVRERQTACLLSFRSISDASWIAASQRFRSGEPCNDRWNERQRCLCKAGIMEKV